MNHPAHYAAKMHTVEVLWRLKNSRDITIGPEPRLVLSVRAHRDVELTSLLVQFPELTVKTGLAISFLAEVPHVYGLRKLKPEGEPWVRGQEDVDARPMLDGKPEDGIKAVSELRWDGFAVHVLDRNLNPSPNNFWCWRGRVAIPKGASVGVIVSCDVPTFCRVKMSGE